MYTYAELLGKIEVVVALLNAWRPIGDNIVSIDANTADEESDSAWAIYEIDATTWLDISRDDDNYATLCLFLYDKGWQIDMHMGDDYVTLPPQPPLLVNAPPASVASYVELALIYAEPALRH
ncbi:hypothetical protein GCM10010464_00430 [Pseudonocardia yunnanensis]|uniref:Uncharacterized protein n=1 Tax=Pseudonocardia yunnanensis TaxID=58107 RepID=A0ABW4FC83_9PSEU